MDSLTFKQAVLQKYNLPEEEFEGFVLKKTLFFRVKLVRPFVGLFNTNYLFNEKVLIREAGKSIRLSQVHGEVDFYQHKYVVGSIMKEAFKFRVSGEKLIGLAARAFARDKSGN
jgi:hypothetical protein